ncbi:MAG TPA: class I SAM-dependent methyltransferase [Solirubrobacteraceae bacterium]|nr:class I SAM-dependent methyltransferase [Solirubrobacteraceae bacterium]
MDTAERSLTHWSEAGRAEMDAFYALAYRDYERLARGVVDHCAWLRRVAAGRRAITLLDVACGSGKFPRALQEFGGIAALAGELHIGYDLLDPSPFSLAEAARALAPPFVAAARHETLVEALPDGVGPFDVVWATHALYALTPDAVGAAAARMLSAVAPEGALLIAQGSREGHYLRFYRHFLDDLRGGTGTMYTAAEDLAGALRRCGAEPRTVRLSYDHTIALADTAIVEGYLQRCAFDDSVSLNAMLAAPQLGPYLRGCRDEDGGVWRFHHKVDVLLLGPAFDGVTHPSGQLG